jgi:RimJ/RimL family protein N-acetyltransferase
MNYILETERLRLREFNLSDTAFIIELLNSPGWLQFIGDRNVKTAEQAKVYLENGPIKSFRDNGFGLALVETKNTNISIGMCGLIRREYLDSPDIGFAFLPAFFNNGYAFEIAKATMTNAKEQLKLPKISAITVASNSSSIKLLEKLGLAFTGTISLPNGSEEVSLYSN